MYYFVAETITTRYRYSMSWEMENVVVAMDVIERDDMITLNVVGGGFIRLFPSWLKSG